MSASSPSWRRGCFDQAICLCYPVPWPLFEPAMISGELVYYTLLPWLGSAFLQDEVALCEQAALFLTGFRPERDSLTMLAERLDSLIFMTVRDRTLGRMALLLDNGQLIRPRMEDYAIMADELLYLLFARLPLSGTNQALIREYSLRLGSLAALRALYLHYRGLHSQEETDTLRRVITGSHPPWRWAQWIDTE